MQIYCPRDHVEVHPQKQKELLYLVKKTTTTKTRKKKTRTTERYGYKL